MKETKEIKVQVRLGREVVKGIDDRARAGGLTRSEYIRGILGGVVQGERVVVQKADVVQKVVVQERKRSTGVVQRDLKELSKGEMVKKAQEIKGGIEYGRVDYDPDDIFTTPQRI